MRGILTNTAVAISCVAVLYWGCFAPLPADLQQAPPYAFKSSEPQTVEKAEVQFESLPDVALRRFPNEPKPKPTLSTTLPKLKPPALKVELIGVAREDGRDVALLKTQSEGLLFKSEGQTFGNPPATVVEIGKDKVKVRYHERELVFGLKR